MTLRDFDPYALLFMLGTVIGIVSASAYLYFMNP
jgi:uncharacterized membrane protein YccC